MENRFTFYHFFENKAHFFPNGLRRIKQLPGSMPSELSLLPKPSAFYPTVHPELSLLPKPLAFHNTTCWSLATTRALGILQYISSSHYTTQVLDILPSLGISTTVLPKLQAFLAKLLQLVMGGDICSTCCAFFSVIFPPECTLFHRITFRLFSAFVASVTTLSRTKNRIINFFSTIDKKNYKKLFQQVKFHFEANSTIKILLLWFKH